MPCRLICLSLLVVASFAAACGSVATPEWSSEAQGTRAAQAETASYQTLNAPTATFTFTPMPTATPITPTATPVPPTATPVPPTATASPTPEQSNPGSATEIAVALPGDPGNGQRLFNELQPEVGFACATCHRVDSEERLIGPGLLNVSARAAHRPGNQSAEEYIRTSIINPGAFVVEGYPDMLMPRIYSQIFTEQEINDLVAYLLTL